MSAPSVELRPASWADVDRVWRWNNAADVRARSIDPEPIGRSEHERWFRARLAEADHFMWIAVAGGADIGVVRIDGRAAGGATVSIALDAGARGRGLGRESLAAACRAFAGARPGAAIEAWIAEDNHASVRCFEGCGFHRVGAAERGARNFLIYRK